MDDLQTPSSPSTSDQQAASDPRPEEPVLASAEAGHAVPGVHMRSKKMLFRVALAIAILNPVASGLLIGIYFWREPELRREGKIVTAVALLWGAIVLVLAFAPPAKGLHIFQ